MTSSTSTKREALGGEGEAENTHYTAGGILLFAHAQAALDGATSVPDDIQGGAGLSIPYPFNGLVSWEDSPTGGFYRDFHPTLLNSNSLGVGFECCGYVNGVEGNGDNKDLVVLLTSEADILQTCNLQVKSRVSGSILNPLNGTGFYYDPFSGGFRITELEDNSPNDVYSQLFDVNRMLAKYPEAKYEVLSAGLDYQTVTIPLPNQKDPEDLSRLDLQKPFWAIINYKGGLVDGNFVVEIETSVSERTTLYLPANLSGPKTMVLDGVRTQGFNVKGVAYLNPSSPFTDWEAAKKQVKLWETSPHIVPELMYLE